MGNRTIKGEITMSAMTQEEKAKENANTMKKNVIKLNEKQQKGGNQMSWRYRTWLLSGVWMPVYWID